MEAYGVSRIVAKMAIRVLRGEGLIVSHAGKGSFVKTRIRLRRDSTARYQRAASPPFAGDADAAGVEGTWEHATRREAASTVVAERLGVEGGAPVMRTEYVFSANGESIQFSTSWEPLAVTADSGVEYPEESLVKGVIARMDHIGVRVDHVSEHVTARAAVPSELERLRLPLDGAYVLVIERTHWAAERPVETCDIVFPGDRYELIYDIPVS
jgi:GntR family transcriptional regulator